MRSYYHSWARTKDFPLHLHERNIRKVTIVPAMKKSIQLINVYSLAVKKKAGFDHVHIYFLLYIEIN